MLLQLNTYMSRVLYAFTYLALVQLGWVLTFFTNDQNVYNTLASGVGALVARFFFPRVQPLVSAGGWFVGFAVAMLVGRSAYNMHLMHPAIEEQVVFGLVAMAADLVVQVIAWVVRLSSKVGDYAEQHPGAAFDEGLDKVEKVAGVWVRIQTPLTSLIDFAKQFFKHS